MEWSGSQRRRRDEEEDEDKQLDRARIKKAGRAQAADRGRESEPRYFNYRATCKSRRPFRQARHVLGSVVSQLNSHRLSGDERDA